MEKTQFGYVVTADELDPRPVYLTVMERKAWEFRRNMEKDLARSRFFRMCRALQRVTDGK